MHFPHSYIGVTGITSPVETLRLVAAHADAGAHRRLAIGVLVSGYATSNARSNRYPELHHIPQMYGAPPCINAIHYTPNKDLAITEQISEVGFLLNPTVVQLNATWPVLGGDLRSYAPSEGNSKQRIILQIGSRAMRVIDRDPQLIAKQILQYANREGIAGVLLDESSGQGRSLDVDFCLACLRAIRRTKAKIHCGIAGGLCADTIPRLEPIIREFPDVSIDAEGALRTPDDHLDMNRAIAYIRAANELYARVG